MAQQKRSTPQKAATAEPVPNVKPMPFPGESPTVALAMAAGQKYGLQPEDEKPARARPKRRTAAKKAAKPARKAPARRKGAGAKARAR